MSEQLWADYAYADDEPDRVVLCVELEAESPEGGRFHEASLIDAVGRPGATAMARLVSLPVMYATEAVLAGEIAPGVSTAPSDNSLIERWFDRLAAQGDPVEHRIVDQ